MDIDFSNKFVHDITKYKRDIDVVKHYIDLASSYLSIEKKKPIEECREFIIKNLKPEGLFPFKDKKITYLHRGENGDRVKKEGGLYRYILDTIKNNEMLAPTFTTYTNPKIKQSLISLYTDGNIAKRGVAKKKEFKYKAAKNYVQSDIKKVAQKGFKLANNGLSGAYNSASTPLYNKSAHSTLTSICRSTSGYGNANNEKFLSGNRHYYSKDVILNNIVTIVSNTDYYQLEMLMSKYNIHYPTHIEVMNCITYSTHFYISDRAIINSINDFVVKLTPLQCAAFCYTGDLFHLMKHNDQLVRDIFNKLSSKVNGIHKDPQSTLKTAPESYINLAHQICRKETAGIGKDNSKIADTPAVHTLALTVENIALVINEYSDIIKILWTPEILPASVAHLPKSIRRSALTSDTDSTIFTVQDWVEWHRGSLYYNDESYATFGVAVFLAASTITHILAKMSANIGVIEKNISRLRMKSEFMFDVFVPTQLGKHYYASISCREGFIYDELEEEIKGVQLKSANVPKIITDAAKQMMKDIMHDALYKQEISLFDYFKRVADIEREIEASIRRGELIYLRGGGVKEADAYSAKEPEDSPFQNYLLWKEVFAPKYGDVTPPPYNTKKLAVTTINRNKMNLWVETIKDQAFKNRLIKYLEKNEKTHIGIFNFPSQALNSRGVPVEILDIIDYEKIQLDICKIFYIILETLGHYSVGKKINRLLSKNGF